MSSLIGLKLKEFGLELREMAAKGEKAATIEGRKEEMLSTVYRMLVRLWECHRLSSTMYVRTARGMWWLQSITHRCRSWKNTVIRTC